ncbi:hypothetical protein [Streptomyces sp. NPDC060027]|uniref:hypothetical protein n=1 Tax=Streptomyces sp. NPDC060027 TaxID=3347040 RepID=UPI0036A8E0AF
MDLGVALVAFALGPVLLAGVAVVAIVVHGRIAARAVERARREDLPHLVDVSGTALARLLSEVRPRLRRIAVPTAAVQDQTVDGVVGGEEGAR